MALVMMFFLAMSIWIALPVFGASSPQIVGDAPCPYHWAKNGWGNCSQFIFKYVNVHSGRCYYTRGGESTPHTQYKLQMIRQREACMDAINDLGYDYLGTKSVGNTPTGCVKGGSKQVYFNPSGSNLYRECDIYSCLCTQVFAITTTTTTSSTTSSTSTSTSTTSTTTTFDSLFDILTNLNSLANPTTNRPNTLADDASNAMSMVLIVVGSVVGGCCLCLCCCYLFSGGSSSTQLKCPSATDGDDAEVVEEGRGTRVTAAFRDTIPSYWTNVNTRQEFDQMIHVSMNEHKYFDDLLSASYHPKTTQDRLCPNGTCPKTPGGCPCVQPGVGLPEGYRVRRVIRVEDSKMWERYQKRLNEIKALREGESIHPMDPPAKTDEIADSSPEVFEPLDASINELYVWHGTNVRAALSIAQNDFNIDLAGSGAGTMYGCGAYCAESSTKADEYAKDEPRGYYQGVFALLLCRTVMGKMYYTTQRDTSAGGKVASGSYDSTLGDRTKHTGTFREFVIYNADQVYPEYIVLYARMGVNDHPAEFDYAVQANPFHMELPIYWTNCHKNPNTTPFQTHYIVDNRAKVKLEELARKCCSKNVVLKSAKRIESSSIWSKYVLFKRYLYAKLSDGQELDETEQRLVKMLGGSDQVLAPGNDGFPLPRDIDGMPVLTRKAIEGESLSEALSTEYLDDNLNEHFLWHGTTKAIAETIVTKDFHIPHANEAKHGARFGVGAYFAESLDKSLDYAPVENGVQYVLLCRVLGGSTYHTTEDWKADASVEAATLGHDSILANPEGKGPREFIMMSEDQVYPEYILEIKA